MEFFKPITETQETTAREIKEGIKQLAPPTVAEFPPYDLLEPVEGLASDFEGPDTNFGIYHKSGEFFIGDKLVQLSEDGKIIDVGGTGYLYTLGLYKLLTFKDPFIEDIPATDVLTYHKILTETNTMYINNNPKTNKLKPVSSKVKETAKWDFIIEPAWNRLQGKKKRAKKGYGLKKVVIPGDPNALLEKLDLLMASKAAGNTVVKNELVSVCDELKRQGIFDSKSYKKIMSVL